MNINIAVRREYFEQIKAGTKRYEFRLANEYWRKRLEGREYDKIIITLGYPKRHDETRRMVFEWGGCFKKLHQHKEFGKEEVEVYAIPLDPKTQWKQ